MSKTDNTRPWQVQAADVTIPGYWLYWRGESQRIPYHPGGRRYLGGAFKIERKQRRREIRARERVELIRVIRAGKDEDFDLKPKWIDAKNIFEYLS